MRVHIILPGEEPDTDIAEVVRLGVRAEELGFAGIWLPDHPLPYAYGGTWGGVFEPLVTLSYLAARTTTVRLGTAVLVAALRNPYLLAKQAATADVLSGGRFELGVGVGIVEQEFANMGADFHTRGARTDEIIRVMRHLWRSGSGPFEGTFYPLGERAVFEPRPVQGDELPIWIGGRSDAAWRRAARLGQGWMSARTEPGDFARNVARMRELAGRPVLAGARIEFDDPAADADGARETVEIWRDAGTDDLFLWLGDVSGYEKRMALIADAMAQG